MLPDPNVHFNMMVILDPFTKWVEVAVLHVLNSFETAKCFHKMVIYRYGLHTKVKADRCTEYHGEFDWYLKLDSIYIALISTIHLCANG